MNGKRIALVAFLGFVFSVNTAFATYTWVDYTLPANTPFSAHDKISGLLNDNRIDIYYNATGSYSQISEIVIPFCQYGATPSGTVDLEVRAWSGTATATSWGSIVASSSVSLSTVTLCDSDVTSGAYVVGTTTTFALNNYISGWSIPLVFSFYGRNMGLLSTSLAWKDRGISPTWGTLPADYYWTAVWGSSNWSPQYKLIGNGIPPPPTINAETAYSSSTIAIYCEPTSWADFGCLFSNAIAWAFVIPDDAFDDFSTLADEIKRKPPLGYFTSAAAAIGSIATTSTTTLSIPAPIMTLVFTPLRAALVLIMGFAGLIWLYNRVKNITV